MKRKKYEDDDKEGNEKPKKKPINMIKRKKMRLS